MNKKFLFSVVFIFFLSCFSFAEEVTTIKIVNSQKTEYIKDKDSGNETIFLEGAVELSVTKGSVVTNVTADTVSYDRVTKMLFAKGNIHLTTQGSASGDENITADSLIMNTSTLEGVFDGGRVIQTKSDAINLPSGSTLVVFSNLFGKSESNVLSFKNASMTFCDDEDPHWKIDATRMWLLSGGEFAFLNAVLYVGKVPVLYLPAFYYPKDELLFNPVFGYKNRSGYYIQTTTYLLGRKGLNSGSSSSSSDSSDEDKALESLYSFMSPSTLKEQKREGIVLHNLDEDYKGDTSHYVKLIADWYSNSGIVTGIEGNLQPQGNVISKLIFAADLGFTNTVFSNNGKYSPISSQGIRYSESSNFMNFKLPFRYKGNIEIGLNKPFRINLSLPIYSDPFIGNELNNRNESLNWISALKEYLEKDDSQTETVSEVSSFVWNLTGSYSPSLPNFMKPYVSSLSLSANSSVNISSVSADRNELALLNGNEWAGATSQRRFYYPSIVTPFKGDISFSGTLFKYSSSGNNTRTSSSKEKVTPAFPLIKPESFDDSVKNEAVSEENEQGNENGESEQDVLSEPVKDFFTENYQEPKLSVSGSSSSSDVPGLDYNLTYTVNSSFNSQLGYASENLKTPEDFNWKNFRSSMYTFKVPVTLNSTMNYGGSFISLSNKISYDPLWQDHPFISDDPLIGGYSESSIKSMKKTDYQAVKQDILNTNSFSIKPFAYLPVFTDSSISYNSNIKLFRREFTGDVDSPVWENKTAEWDEDSITAHSLSFNLSAVENDSKFKQSLSMTSSLPPLDEKYTLSGNLTFPYVNVSLGTGFYKDSKSEDKEKFYMNPLTESLSFSYKVLGSSLSLSQSYSYSLEDKKHESFKTSLSWYGISVSFSMSESYTYDFDITKGWIQRAEKSFVPYSLTGSYSVPSKTFYTWKNRVSVTPGLQTSISADLIRPTNSYLTFSPSLSFKLNQFMSLTFSSTSRNSVIYRYFQNLGDSEQRIPGETNPFIDLANSFRFDNKKLRESSGFKLKSLNMSLEHELHDWKLQMSAKVEPRLITENGKKRYDFSPYFSFGVVWVPMEAIKTSIIDEYGEWKLD